MGRLFQVVGWVFVCVHLYPRIHPYTRPKILAILSIFKQRAAPVSVETLPAQLSDFQALSDFQKSAAKCQGIGALMASAAG